MDGLISRAEAKEALRERLKRNPTYAIWAMAVIDELPSVQPRKGKWMPDNTNYYDERYICSECNANYKVDTCMGKPSWNFCPNCGADMRSKAR